LATFISKMLTVVLCTLVCVFSVASWSDHTRPVSTQHGHSSASSGWCLFSLFLRHIFHHWICGNWS